MNTRLHIVVISALYLLSSCTTALSNNATTQQPSALRHVASEKLITTEQAKQNLEEGIGFGLSCSRPDGAQMSVSIDFYLPAGKNNSPTTERYIGKYTDITDAFKKSNSLKDVKPGTKNRILQSGDFQYWVTPHSIRISDNQQGDGAYIADIRSALKTTCFENRTYMPEEPSEFYVSESYLPVSIVGPYITVQYSANGYTGGAHPYAITSFETRKADSISTIRTERDVTRVASDKFNLFQIAPESEILTALKNDSYLKKKIGSSLLAKAKNTSDVHQLMFERMNNQCDISIPSGKNEAFSQIAIYDYDATKNKMQVRVGYLYGCEAMRGNFTQLGLTLTPTPAFRSYLQAELSSAADQGRKPYFMRYSQQLR